MRLHLYYEVEDCSIECHEATSVLRSGRLLPRVSKIVLQLDVDTIGISIWWLIVIEFGKFN